jgi:hypothetical protein
MQMALAILMVSLGIPILHAGHQCGQSWFSPEIPTSTIVPLKLNGLDLGRFRQLSNGERFVNCAKKFSSGKTFAPGAVHRIGLQETVETQSTRTQKGGQFTHESQPFAPSTASRRHIQHKAGQWRVPHNIALTDLPLPCARSDFRAQ